MAISLRPATAEDSRTLWLWRNDRLMRANARNTDEISWHEHSSWFEGKIGASQNCKIYVAESGGQPCAMLRFDRRQADLWELSWNVAPEFRRRGLGGELLKAAVLLHPWSLVAFIKRANGPSVRIAENAGFVRWAEGQDGVDEFRFLRT